MASPQRPLTGVRLTYELTMGTVKYRVRIKESIGKWLGLRPVGPQTGTFASGPNSGRRFLRAPAGFKFQSFTFLLRPGVTITEPIPGDCTGGTRSREICTFTLGFPRGLKETPINRWRVESWARGTTRANDIIGMITPSGVKHVWRESLAGQTGILPNGLPNLPSLPDGFDLGDVIGLTGSILPLLF
ncbi:MAG: hypothetical protein RLZZ507_4378 [Cyanobacteriota bacterium]|jgi:hypothetical protein